MVPQKADTGSNAHNEMLEQSELKVEEIIERCGADVKNLIPILQEIQDTLGFLSGEAISKVAGRLCISGDVIFGVATFYSQFRFNKPGRHQIKVCVGTACHVRGGHEIMETIERRLDIGDGETTGDGIFSLERVACMGCCALAPVIAVDDDIYGSCTPAKVDDIISGYEKEGSK